MITDFDDAYQNMAYIPGGAEYPERWSRTAAAFRANLPDGVSAELDLSYGPSPRQRIDLFHPKGSPQGLAIFVHGGYWMRFEKSHWSHLAQGALQRGWAVAMPGYTLCPDIKIGGITSEIARAISLISTQINGPIRLCGHSAGGHLVTRMLCEPSQLQDEVLSRVAHVISISGVHDLRPLLQTKNNDTLHLTELEARSESPALRRPNLGIPVTAWVGADERPEFVRQTDLLANIWHGLGVDITLHHEPSRHHFDVIDDLADPNSTLCEIFAP
jgi:arylformamidase